MAAALTRPEGPTGPDVDVVVRTLNAGATLPATVASLRAQRDVVVHLVVVDSGSTDTTLELAAEHAEHLVRLPPGGFSFGGALNAGAAAGSAPFLAAVSAHTVLPRPDWLARAVAHLRDPGVAATCGAPRDPGGAPLAGPLRQHAGLVTHPYWGLSNTASAWRRNVWERVAFDETMAACEDKEWAWRVLHEGLAVVLDPALVIDDGHRRAQGRRALFDRHRREALELAARVVLPPATLHRYARSAWGLDASVTGWRVAARLASPTRVIQLAGQVTGEWQGRRRPGAPGASTARGT